MGTKTLNADEAKLNKLRSDAEALAKEIKAKRETEDKRLAGVVADMPKQFGVATHQEVIRIIRRLSGIKGTGKVKITPEKRAEVIKLLKADEKTGQEIAEAVGLSISSVQKIKETAGMVKSRS